MRFRYLDLDNSDYVKHTDAAIFLEVPPSFGSEALLIRTTIIGMLDMDSTVAPGPHHWGHLNSACNWNTDSLLVRQPSTEFLNRDTCVVLPERRVFSE